MKRVQKHRAYVRLPLVSGLLVAALMWMPLGAAATDSTSRYGQCMALAATNPDAALEKAMAWTEKGGGDPAGHCAATALMGLARYKEAAEAFELLAQNSSAHPPERAALLGQAGQAWLLAGDPEKAADVLSRALTLTPDDAALRVDRAQASYDLRRYGQSITDLDTALTIDPKLVDAYVFRASAYRRLGDLEKAEAEADTALSLNNVHPEALLERGIIHRLKDDRVGARRDWLTLITVAPHSEAARVAKANLDRMDAGINFE